MKFRPCIDLHNGSVKQIIGGTLRAGIEPVTNFVAEQSAAWFARRYAADNLTGGHIIRLGPGNDEAAREALAAWPGGMQIGGGITADNAAEWLVAGADKVIVTSSIFQHGQLDKERLNRLVSKVGRGNLVLDLSCRRKDGCFHVVADRWQTLTRTLINAATLDELADCCSEFLIHGVDVEGKRQGLDEKLVKLLAAHSPIPCVYAGGVRSMKDLMWIRHIGEGRIDVTIGSALDLFGGTLLYRDVVAYCR